MARILISNWGEKALEVTDLSKTLLQHIHDHRLDWMHACGAKGRCTTCKAIILEGFEKLSSFTASEEHYRRIGALGNRERLACQVLISGDVIIAIPDDNRLPHVQYE